MIRSNYILYTCLRLFGFPFYLQEVMLEPDIFALCLYDAVLSHPQYWS